MTDTVAASQREGAAQTSHTLWHMAFLAPLAARSGAIPAMKAADLSEHSADAAAIVAAAAYSASVMEAVGYPKAAAEVERLLQHRENASENGGGAAPATPSCSWFDVFADCTRQHAEQIVMAKAEATDVLPKILRATQQHCASAERLVSASPFDALFARLATACLSRGAPQSSPAPAADALPDADGVSLLHVEAAAAPSSPAAAAPRLLQRQWHEARLYGALTCAVGSSAPAPLARLLAAYVHVGDGRLQEAADATLAAHLHAADPKAFAALADTGAGHATDCAVGVTATAAASAQARLSGVVAGVLEYALHAARTRSSATVAALNAHAAAATSTAAPESSSLNSVCTNASQRAALLLVQITEECGYYHQTAAAGTSSPPTSAVECATQAAMAVVHAVQELLFSIVLGGGTQRMQNRPEPVPPKKVVTAGAAPTPALLVTTTRGVVLAEADAITQELFPSLVQQLGLEWVWSQLLRHLATLDRQPQPARAAASAVPVRWSSHAVIDMVLLTLARKVYPQRLLNILPGSYERLLQQLNLLPPAPLQADDGSALPSTVAAAAASQATLFEMPAYYAEPAASLVAYFERAGVAGVRLEEVSRTLSNATSSYAMMVRLKAQAPPSTELSEDGGAVRGGGLNGGGGGSSRHLDEDGDAKTKDRPAHSYALSLERVRTLISRYRGEVLLAAVIVYTQLRIPSQVQQLMRALAPLFLAIQLDWRTHHDGSITGWFLQPIADESSSNSGGGGGGGATRGVRLSSEATVLLDKVGYEFYPLEWLPAVAASLSGGGTLSTVPFPYSLCAAVSHQFRLRLRGTPLGASGDATLRHPAGPRTSVVMPDGGAASLLSPEAKAEDTAAAWQRTQRFLVVLMEVCYLDARTSSTELEGTLAVSSTRRVLTTSGGAAPGSYGGGGGGAGLVAAADIASQRLRSLLQQPAVMDAMWGTMDPNQQPQQQRASAAPPHARDAQRGQKRPRNESASSASARAAAEAHLQSMARLLLDYGAASFDATIEAADFALVVAQAFLPSTAGTCTTSGQQEKRSAALLRVALEWGRDAVGTSANRARVNMLLQQQRQSSSGSASTSVAALSPLQHAYNSATMDTAWLARRALRFVPCRILEKIETARTEVDALAQREKQWMSRLPTAGAGAAAEEETQKPADEQRSAAMSAAYRVNPLLMEQWTQCARVWQQLGLAEGMDGHGGAAAAALQASAAAAPASAEEVSCVQWLWYSPYFGEEWTA